MVNGVDWNKIRIMVLQILKYGFIEYKRTTDPAVFRMRKNNVLEMTSPNKRNVFSSSQGNYSLIANLFMEKAVS